MHNIDLEKFYKKIDKSIKLCSSYLGMPKLSFLIRSCRLKPLSLFVNKWSWGTKFENIWIDEFGNSLNIVDKNLSISLKDTRIKEKWICGTDLFYGKDIKSVFEDAITYLKTDDFFYLAYCSDEYMRAFKKEDNEIVVASPLEVGLISLFLMIDNLKTGKQKQFQIENKIITISSSKEDFLNGEI